MKLLFVHRDIYNYKNAGSIKVTSLIKEIEKISKVKRIYIITTKSKKNLFSNKILIFNFPFYSNKNIFIDFISFIFFLIYSYVISLFIKFDVIYTSSSKLGSSFLGALICKKNSKYILDIRDLLVDTFKSITKNKYNMINFILKLLENYSYKKASKINIVSEGFKKYLYNYSNKLLFYPNGVDEFFLKNIINNKKKTLNNITYVGNVGLGQDIHYFLPNLAKANPLKTFKVYGKGKYHNELIEYKKKLKINNLFIFNSIDRKNLNKVYANSGILIINLANFDCFQKSLPSKIFEYAASNKPIIAGVDGYAKKFFSKIDGVFFYKKNNIEHCSKVLNAITKFKYNRREFLKQYNRKKINLEYIKAILD